MPNYMTLTDRVANTHIAIPEFTTNPTDVVKNISISTNRRFVGCTIRTENGENVTQSAFVRDLQTNSVIRVVGHQTEESDIPTLAMDSTSRFGCFIDGTRFLQIFDLSTGAPIRINLASSVELYRFVGAVFSPVRQRLYLAFVNEESGAALTGMSGIMVIDTTVWATDTIINVPWLFKNESGYQPPTHCKMSVSHDGAKLIVPNANSSIVEIDLDNYTLRNLGLSDNELLTLGVLSKSVTVKHPIERARVFNYPSFEQRTEPPGIDDTLVTDIKIQDGHTHETPYSYIESAPTQYLYSFSGANYRPDLYIHDPMTKAPVCFKPAFVNHTALPVPNRPTSVLDLYTRLCNGLGLDPNIAVPELLNDDTCVVRSSLVTPFNTLGIQSASPLWFTVSPDAGFALYLRNTGNVTSYNTAILGKTDEAMTRASFCTSTPPFLMLNSKPKDWDVRTVEYREQKSSQYTIAYLQYQEIYGNYPGTREMVMLISSNGRIDYAISGDPTELSKMRWLVFNELLTPKQVTSLFGTFVVPSNQSELLWYSNASRFGIDPLDLIR